MSGCTGLKHTSPQPELNMPRTWPSVAASSRAHDSERGNDRDALDELAGSDDVLRGLLGEAALRNFDIRRARLRWQQAGLSLRDAELARRPTLSASASTSASQPLSAAVTEVNVGGVPVQVAGSTALSKSFGLSLSASYELDLWGRLDQLQSASEVSRDSAGVDLVNARWLATAQVAEKYWRIAALDEKHSLSSAQWLAAQSLVPIVRAKREAGIVRAVEFLRAEESARIAERRVAEIESERVQYVAEIAILLERPAHAFALPRAHLPTWPMHRLPLDTPAAVIERRPDVQHARLALVRATTQLNLAEIDRLPNVSLSLPSVGSGAASLGDLLRTPVAGIGASVTAPIFDWRKRLRARDREQLALEVAVLDYVERVHKALVEVTRLLAASETTYLRYDAVVQREQQTRAEQRARQVEYEVGKIEKTKLIEVANALRDVHLDAVDARLTAQLDRLNVMKAIARPLAAGEANRGAVAGIVHAIYAIDKSDAENPCKKSA